VTVLETFGRDEFIAERFRWRSGEHVTIIGPTGCGKSHLVYQLLEHVATPRLPAVVLVKKPKDPLILRRGKELGYETVRTWPPATISTVFHAKPSGWLVWPKTKYDPLVDRPAKREVFRRALLDSYKKGNRIVVVDDAYGVSKLLDLREELIELWTEMRSQPGAVWAAFQRTADVPLWAYSQAEHLILFNDPDRRARDRYAEIGGIDPAMVRDTTGALKRHQALYIRRDGPAVCIIDK